MNNYPLRSKKRAAGQVWDLTEESDGSTSLENSRSKHDPDKTSREHRATQPKSKTIPIMKPELVTSSDSNYHQSECEFDEEDFEKLRQRYLLPRIQMNTELPTGMTLRKTHKPRLIDLKTPGFKRLRKKIDELVKKDDRLEVYRLLCQVRNYEIDPRRVPAVMQERNHDGDVTEVLDLTQDDGNGDNKECFNVDEYITNVLLPRDEAGSGPDCVMSANVKVDDVAVSLPKSNDVIEGQITPKPKHRSAEVTPEKSLELVRSADTVNQVSASTSRSSTPTDARQIQENVTCKGGNHNQSERVEPKLCRLLLLPKNVIEHVYDTKGRNIALAKRSSTKLDSKVSQQNDVLAYTAREKIMKKRNVCIINVSMLSPPKFVATNKYSQQVSLAKEWRSQTRRRRQGEWIPSGHITGRWKKPAWVKNLNEDSSTSKISSAQRSSTCKKSLLPTLHKLVSAYLEFAAPLITMEHFKSLQDVTCPTYFEPTHDLLYHAHEAVSNLLPDGDCEEFDVIKLARAYYDYWRPDKVKVILLAESHAHTDKNRCFNGPKFNCALLEDVYQEGPCDFISLVYCLAYGENESLIPSMNDKNNKGTTQFWTLFAAIARGVDYVAPCRTGKVFASPFAADILKGGGLPVQERLRAKLDILKDLKRRGIWLLDVSVFGWYISQPQQYTRSSISNEVHRLQKARPPSQLKAPSLVLSWELYTKHLIRQVAKEGHLKLLVPIGMEVELAITRRRMIEAVSVCEVTEISDTMPAPNAWIPGGYGPFHAKLQQLVEKAAPR